MKETNVKVWAGVIALTFASMSQAAAATPTLSLVYGPINNPGSLIQASDGNFYSVARNTNFYYPSTVFKVTPDGHFTTLFSAPYIPSGGMSGSLLVIEF